MTSRMTPQSLVAISTENSPNSGKSLQRSKKRLQRSKKRLQRSKRRTCKLKGLSGLARQPPGKVSKGTRRRLRISFRASILSTRLSIALRRENVDCDTITSGGQQKKKKKKEKRPECI